MSQEQPHIEERHASWPELFFDLVAVAGVSVVAHQLEADQPWQHIAVLAIAFAAFWIVWASVTTYGNLLADRTSIVVLFTSMALMGVMVASVPEIYGEHARAFAVAYVVSRLLLARPWSRTAVVVDMPIVQASIGVLPWTVSIWISGDSRYIWWAVGIGLDLWVLLTVSGQRRVEDAQRRLDRVIAARGTRPGRGPEVPSTTITTLKADTTHLAERMGLFVLIILGESIVQLIAAAETSEHWDRALLSAAIGGFAFVAVVFLAAVVRGTAGLALLPSAQLPVRALWLGHLVVSLALVTVGAAVGRLLEEPREPISVHTMWMLVLGTATFALISALAHALSHEPRRLALAAAFAVPALAAALVVAVTHGSLPARWVGWILAAGVTGGVSLAGRTSRAQAPPQA